ncbi:hypothetical protein PEC18_12240 [Paucibacter sp. O1-1]|nr:hypothetical protein [Paucibacter sp. O1-1]MDA3826586.1 hypothetical protein [Paucibacter sp. O1-1]
MKTISVHLYEVSSATGRDLTGLIRGISHTPKARRWRKVSLHDMALMESQFDAENQLYLLDFVKRREVGPGKVRRDSDIEAFPFAAGENFGEETAALWDPARGWLALQFNQHGVRAGSIANYFNSYDHDPGNDWLVMPKLDDNAAAMLRRRPHVRAAHMKFSVTPALTEAMRDNGEAMGAALSAMSTEAGSAHVEVSFTMGHNNGFIDRSVGTMMRRLSQVFGQEDGLKSMQITAREQADSMDKVIDLLEHRVKGGFSDRELEIEGGRYTVRSRWHALRRLHAGWTQEF